MDGESRERVCLGAITGAHGIKGEVRIKVFAENAEDFAAYGALMNEDMARRFDIVRVRASGNGAVAKIKGVNDRSAAEKLKGERLYVLRSALPETGEEEWYHADLVGLKVERQNGTRFGTVAAIHDFGAGDLIEVKPDDDGGTVLMPFTREQFPVVDVAGGRLVAEPLEQEADDVDDGDNAQENRTDAGANGEPERQG